MHKFVCCDSVEESWLPWWLVRMVRNMEKMMVATIVPIIMFGNGCGWSLDILHGCYRCLFASTASWTIWFCHYIIILALQVILGPLKNALKSSILHIFSDPNLIHIPLQTFFPQELFHGNVLINRVEAQAEYLHSSRGATPPQLRSARAQSSRAQEGRGGVHVKGCDGSMLCSRHVAKEAPPTKGSRQRTMQLPPGGTWDGAGRGRWRQVAAGQGAHSESTGADFARNFGKIELNSGIGLMNSLGIRADFLEENFRIPSLNQ